MYQIKTLLLLCVAAAMFGCHSNTDEVNQRLGSIERSQRELTGAIANTPKPETLALKAKGEAEAVARTYVYANDIRQLSACNEPTGRLSEAPSYATHPTFMRAEFRQACKATVVKYIAERSEAKRQVLAQARVKEAKLAAAAAAKKAQQIAQVAADEKARQFAQQVNKRR